MKFPTEGDLNMSCSVGLPQTPLSSNPSPFSDLPSMFYPPISSDNLPPQPPSEKKSASSNTPPAPLPMSIGSESLSYLNAHQLGQVQMGVPLSLTPPLFGSRLPSSHMTASKPQWSFGIQPPTPVMVGSQSAAQQKKKLPQSAQGGGYLQANKQLLQKGPQSKVTSESYASVRSKLRESLAASLKINSDKESNEQDLNKQSQSSDDQQKEDSKDGENMGTYIFQNSSEATLSTSLDDKSCDGYKMPENSTVEMSKKLDSINGGILKLEGQFDSRVGLDGSVFAVDELLQGHGLSWASDSSVNDGEPDSKRTKIADEVRDIREQRKTKLDANDAMEREQRAEILAVRIEEELFRLFGGVNKRYKEKARSLLFNLKDRNNPELRKRVFSGDISPERLCMMTAEELASKELSQWRLAKAEELAQMVVLPDSEVDIRRLVRKTHKGEFQVEVEHSDSVSVEAEVGGSSQARAKNNRRSKLKPKSKVQATATSRKSGESSASNGILQCENGDVDKVDSARLDELFVEKTDLLQELMVDELKDAADLPPVVSLDEFMEALDSEPPFVDLSTMQDLESSGKGQLNTSEFITESEGPGSLGETSEDCAGSKPESTAKDDQLQTMSAGETVKDSVLTPSTRKGNARISLPDQDLMKESDEREKQTSDLKINSSNIIWEGIVQLNVSSLANVIALFGSGEKPSVVDWPSIVDIKGRVKLDAFEKFMRDLRLSRSRAVMVVHFAWKEGSHESGRHKFSETIDSYILDGRVGVAEPAAGVELYFCPPHNTMLDILTRLLPQDYLPALRDSSDDGFIGIVVWRRHVKTSIESSRREDGSSKRTYGSRKQKTSIASMVPMSSSAARNMLKSPSSAPNNLPNPTVDNDDVPPGFGPAIARDDDDLPEYDFTNAVKHSAANPHRIPVANSSQIASARSMSQMRELIQKYGRGETSNQPHYQDDDIPEWDPYKDNPLSRPSVLQQQAPLQSSTPNRVLQHQHHLQMAQVNNHVVPTQNSHQLLPLQLQNSPLHIPQNITASQPSQLPGQPSNNVVWSPVAPQHSTGSAMTVMTRPPGFGGGQSYSLPNLGAGQHGRG